MNSEREQMDIFSPTRRRLLLLPLAVWGGSVLANTPVTGAVTPIPGSAAPTGACPLNSGGPSLLGSKWKLMSVYGNTAPKELRVTMEVGQTAMSGRGGCNNYAASFQQVGNRGFKVVNIQQTSNPCEVLRPGDGLPTIDTGAWEGMYLRVLRRAGSVEQKGVTLQFYDFNGKASIVFAKIYGSRSPSA